jgi:hypothetical protein
LLGRGFGEGSLEPLAEAIHERWRTEQKRVHKPAPSLQDLDESRRESNREQARDIGVKLDRIGRGIALLRDWEAADFDYQPGEAEELAIDQHERLVQRAARPEMETHRHAGIR